MTYFDSLPRIQIHSATTGVIDADSNIHIITAGSAATLTLVDPLNSPDWNGRRIVIKPVGAVYAHKIDNSGGSGFDGGGASLDFANFAGSAAVEFLELIAYNGNWYTLGSSGVTVTSS